MTALRTFVSIVLTLTLVACGDDGPVLDDRDAGPSDDAGPVDSGPVDAGPGDDAGPVDAGPTCATSDPAVPDEPWRGAWEPGFGNPGVGGDLPNVYALAFDAEGAVYVGGQFTTAGYAPASNIARWDGASGWHTLGEGLPGEVRAMAFSPRGELFVGHAEEIFQDATVLSRWDGTTWTEVTRADGPIEEFAFVDGELLVVGGFTTIGEVAAAGLARWDGTSWSGYAGIAPDRIVRALSATSLDDVCIGGEFETLGVVEAIGAACWNGSAWIARSLPLPGRRGIYDLQRDPADGTLVASGDFMLSEPTEEGGSVARWTAAGWELIGGGLMSEFGPGDTKMVRALAFAPSGLYAGGAFRAIHPPDPEPVGAVARFDGTRWRDIGGVFAEIGFGIEMDRVFAVQTGPDGSVYFAGLFTRAGTQAAAHVVRWDGTYWSALRTTGERYEGLTGSVNVIARRGTCETYVGGTFGYAGSVRANNIAAYDRERGFRALGTGVDGNVEAIAVLDDDVVVIGGSFFDETGVSFANLARWDGARWESLGADPDDAVHALATAPGRPDQPSRLFVGGRFSHVGTTPAHALAEFDGTTWRGIGGGFGGFETEWGDPTTPAVRALLRDPDSGDLVVAGSFRTVGESGLVVNNIARWDGERWHAYGEGLGDLFDMPSAMTFWQGRLVVVGSFSRSGEQRVGSVVVWTGSAWEPVGELSLEPYGGLYAVEAVGSALYVGGAFHTTDGTIAHAAVYDGTTYRPLGEGVSDLVQALRAMDEGVYVGGTFDRTGTTPSVGMSLYHFVD